MQRLSFDEGLTSSWQPPQLTNGLVLIDDDPDFCHLMQTYAAAMKVKMVTYFSLLDIHPFASLKSFDMALVDFHLESRSGLEIAEFVDVFFRHLPVVIITGDEELEDMPKEDWPYCVRKCMQKKYGPQAILKRSLSLLSDIQFYRKIANRNHSNH